MIHNIAAYRFTELDNLPTWQLRFKTECQSLVLKGTVLLSHEGINLNLAGSHDAITQFKDWLASEHPFQGMRYHDTYSSTVPFKRLKVKCKKEIITFRDTTTDPTNHSRRAPHLSPQELKTWLDEARNFTLLDTRNQYEVDLGTYVTAHNPGIAHFTELPRCANQLDAAKPLVIVCTGGIRCEKAAYFFQDQGFDVYQLDGGILNYFKEVGGAHWQGSCFVFDERVSVTPTLDPIDP